MGGGGGYKCQLSVKIAAICQLSVNPIQTLYNFLLSSKLPRTHDAASKMKLNEIFAVNEAAAPTNTKKETKFGLSVFTGR